jgi:hypothetical protein
VLKIILLVMYVVIISTKTKAKELTTTQEKARETYNKISNTPTPPHTHIV